MYIDTHCHIDDKKITDTDGVINACTKYGVEKIINMGCEYSSSHNGKILSEKYPIVYYGVGYHPTELDGFNEKTFAKLLTPLVDKKCVAVGEIGLDYHYEDTDKEKQKNAFVSQIEFANFLGLPVSIHSRDAMKDTLDILRANPVKKSGVMHCYSGSVESAKILLDMGFYLGFGGTVTFKNARAVKEVLQYVPTDRILTETDSPYLSPEPFRGQINTPANVCIITNFIAEFLGNDKEKLKAQIIENAERLFTKLK